MTNEEFEEAIGLVLVPIRDLNYNLISRNIGQLVELKIRVVNEDEDRVIKYTRVK